MTDAQIAGVDDAHTNHVSDYCRYLSRSQELFEEAEGQAKRLMPEEQQRAALLTAQAQVAATLALAAATAAASTASTLRQHGRVPHYEGPVIKQAPNAVEYPPR